MCLLYNWSFKITRRAPNPPLNDENQPHGSENELSGGSEMPQQVGNYQKSSSSGNKRKGHHKYGPKRMSTMEEVG